MHLVHNVYFTLHENTPEQRAQLLAAIAQYLPEHEGILYFSAGTLADLSRPVNDRQFEVALHVVFASRAAHDAYQVSPRHVQFIEENRAHWKQVRVFDSDAAPPAGG